MGYSPPADKTPVQQINNELRGSVIDLLRAFMPDLRPYNNDEAYSVILNSPEKTARGFRHFRENRAVFAALLKDGNDQPVTTDAQPLSCGRSLAQVVAMVVQAVARRHFRRRLERNRRTESTRTRLPGLIGRVARTVGMLRPTRPKESGGSADGLFGAMRDYLLYEWQLRLIPHYVGLPVPLVQQLGARLLEFREIEDIRQMARSGQPLLAPTISPAEPTPDAVAQETKLGSYDMLRRIDAKLFKRLMDVLSLDAEQLSKTLHRACQVLPPSEIKICLGGGAFSRELERFIAAVITTRFSATCDDATAAAFTSLFRARSGADAPLPPVG
jgi:hypothetical protein